MFFNLQAQKVVYNKDNEKKKYVKEEVTLTLTDSNVDIPQKPQQELAATLASLIPTAIDLGFKITQNVLEKRQKKFSGEYTAQTSYLNAGGKKVPNIELKREIDLGNGLEDALIINLQAKKIKDLDGFIYYVKSIKLNYSKAKTTSKSKMFDYSIEIKPTFFVDGEKKSQDLSPITLNSIEFGDKIYNDEKYRTQIIPLPKGAYFSDLSIKIVETNPDKVKADKVLEIFNTYKDDAKTVINNFIKKEESSDAPAEGDGTGEVDGDDANDDDSN